MNKKLALGAAAGTALALTLTACGGEGSTNSPKTVNLSAAQALDASVTKTANVESFSAELTIGGAAEVHGTGSFQLKPAPAFSANLDKITFGGLSVGAGGTRVVLLDQNIYVQNQALSQFTGGGKPWLKIGLGEVASRAGFNPDELLNKVSQANPADMAKIVSESIDVKKVGEEKIDGVNTTHYQGTVDFKTALEKYDPELRKKAEGMSNGSEKLNFDFWTDGENLPRKVVAKATTTENKTFDVTVLFRDYGKKVNVAAPPADQTADFKLP